MDRKLRIGQISYTNTLPVTYFFDVNRFETEVEFVAQVPAQLNQEMAKGNIDIGPISSFSYAENADRYFILPDLSVSAKGKVRSIFLFSKIPIEQLEGKTVCLTNTSATSVNLLKIIMATFYGLHVRYEVSPPDLETMMAKADGCLLIGDDALLANRINKRYHVYDLAELWYQFTGYPMTFALWTVRKEALLRHESLIRDIHGEFLHSKRECAIRLSEIIHYVISRFGGEFGFWMEYFKGLTYDFDKEQQEGLALYFSKAAELGLLPGPVRIQLWNSGLGTVKPC